MIKQSRSEQSLLSSPSSSIMASFQSAVSYDAWQSADGYSEHSPLLQRHKEQQESSRSISESYHSCPLSFTAEPQPGSSQLNNREQVPQLLSSDLERGVRYNCAQSLARKKGNILCLCNNHVGIGCIASLSIIKPYLLFGIGIAFMVMIATKGSQSTPQYLVSVSRGSPTYLDIKNAGIVVRMAGPFYFTDLNTKKSLCNITLFVTCGNEKKRDKIKSFSLCTCGNGNFTCTLHEEKYEYLENNQIGKCRVHITTESRQAIPLVYSATQLPKEAALQPWFALVILTTVYLLMMLDLTHYATATMLGSLGMIATLAMLDKPQTLGDVFGWIGEEVETLGMLFGMMIIVDILAETGVSTYIAFKMSRFSQGKNWHWVTSLCLLSALISAFINKTIAVFLLTPITIRLSEIANLVPKKILIAVVLFANIGGTIFVVDNPENILSLGNSLLLHKGIATSTMTFHLVLGVLIVMLFAYITIRIQYRWTEIENTNSESIEELKREADVWERAASRLCYDLPSEKVVKLLLLQKSLMVRNLVIRKMQGRIDNDDKLLKPDRKIQIADWEVLVKSGLVLLLVIVLYCMQGLGHFYLKSGWIFVIGGILLILLTDVQQLGGVFERVDWSTMILIASLFLLARGASELSFFDFIGTRIHSLVINTDSEHRLVVAIVTIVWISALVSIFMVNTPFTSAMIPVIVKLANDPLLKLPLQPLVYALAFGSCLGGNGALVGSSANLVTAGMSEQQGYKISFKAYFKIGFPVMLVTVFIAMCYLLIIHVALRWNS